MFADDTDLFFSSINEDDFLSDMNVNLAKYLSGLEQTHYR